MLNFKKKGIFTRNADADTEPEQESQGGVLAVWGSPGSGKTTTAVKLAQHMASKKQNVVLVLCDMTSPMLPCICPPSELESENSLGSILAAAHVSEPLVKSNLVTLKKNSYLTILDIKKGENEYSYPPYTEVQAKELLDTLVDIAPFVVVGEMRGAEANAAQEAARTGVAVLTTIHSNSCEATYRRMVSLCKRTVDMSDQTLMDYVTDAYPIVVFCKQLDNKQRRMMDIQECETLPDGTRHYRPLFQYVITENSMDGGEFIIEGRHRQVNTISDRLAKRLLENGMPLALIESLKGKGAQTA